jgi:hypothetical protein
MLNATDGCHTAAVGADWSWLHGSMHRGAPTCCVSFCTPCALQNRKALLLEGVTAMSTSLSSTSQNWKQGEAQVAVNRREDF